MFAHLHTHSYFSFLQALPSPAQLAERAAGLGMPALGLTDHHGLTGAVEFYNACRERGVKPVLGLEIRVCFPEIAGSLVFLAMDLQGWGSLCRLSTIVQTRPARDPARGLDVEALAAHTSGLLCLTAGPRGPIDRLLRQGHEPQAAAALGALGELFPGRLYAELVIHDPAGSRTAGVLAALAARSGIPVLATADIHFLKPGDIRLHRTLAAMHASTTVGNLPPEDVVSIEAFFTSPAEMEARFAVFPGALEATLEAAARCNLELPLGVPHYPELPLPPGATALDILRRRAREGAAGRYGMLTPAIEARLDHEFGIIGDRGYAPLFLIMDEILAFARRNGVPTASRGSASSSLVAHCLGITTPDPLEHNLYFERFLNPARRSPPDIDTDLCSTRRERVLRHVYEQYGHERVAMVATINRLRGRSALRESAKAHGLPEAEIKRLTAGLPSRGWGPRRREDDIPYADLAARFPQHRRIFEDARGLLDVPRHLSVHPGGVVIAPGTLTDLVPLHLAGKGLVITQFDLEAVEAMGLLKIDLLGTRGLSVLGDVAEQVHSWKRAEYAGPLQVLDAIPRDDPQTAALVRSTETIGCFQIESPGMRATLREVKAASPQDILIALALYRPGPMTGGLKDAFVQRHLGREPVVHLHPALEPLLGDTLGVILYQEQVLRIASELAGLSLADADLLRRAMSHFDPGERMRTLKARFIEGAGAVSAVPPDTAEQVWQLMAAFAGYGFPKAHAASYAQVAWQSAWCKAHYPAEFMAAVLANWGGYYRQRVYLNVARQMGLRLRPPHVQHARPEFSVAYPQGEPILFMGLNQVRELTRRTQQRILQSRPFRSLDDFLTRVDPRPVEAENLARIGALAGFGTIPALLSRVETGGWRRGQPALFELPGAYEAGEDWSMKERAAAQEAILGVGVEAHTLELLDPAVLEQIAPVSAQAAVEKVGERVRLLGMHRTLQRFFHAGEARYVLELEDLSGVIQVVVGTGLYRRSRDALRSRRPIVTSGRVETDGLWGVPVLVAEELAALAV